MDRTLSQRRKILTYLEQGNQLTPLDALRKFGCLRLSGRIFELRRVGIPIETRLVETRNGARIAAYKINKAVPTGTLF